MEGDGNTKLPVAQVRYDWGPIKEAYLTRTPRPKLAELSAEFGPAPSTIKERINDEGWFTLRQALDARSEENAAEHALEIASSTPLDRLPPSRRETHLRQWDNRGLKMSKMLYALAEKLAAEVKQKLEDCNYERFDDKGKLVFGLQHLSASAEQVSRLAERAMSMERQIHRRDVPGPKHVHQELTMQVTPDRAAEVLAQAERLKQIEGYTEPPDAGKMEAGE